VTVYTSQYSFLTVYHISDTVQYFTVIAVYRSYSLLQKMFVAVCKSNEVESRYLPEKVTSLQVESSV